MQKKKPFDKINDKLYQVESPERYIGREWNSVKKNWNEIDHRVCLAFPDVYEIGMSHLGIRILYHLLNSQENVLCERVFAPWVDMEKLLRENYVELFSLENKRRVKDFDILGFTLQYEMSYTTILNMLDLGNIPIHNENRSDEDPLIIAGGANVFNPEPIADFIDLFYIGEAEKGILELVYQYKNLYRRGFSRAAILNNLSFLDGVYVPDFYEASYSEGSFTDIKPVSEDIKSSVERQFVEDLDEAFFPTEQIVPYMDIVHNRAIIEISRGCQKGCRFCSAGMCYRPARERSREKILGLTEEILENTGYEEISLTSLNTADHTEIVEIVSELNNRFADKMVNISLPSLRVNSFSVELAQQVQKVRRSGLTFAPEAGTQRLRDLINKGVDEEDYFKAVEAAFESGWYRIKLYFMIGLPGERKEDLAGLVKMVQKTSELGREIRKKSGYNMKPIEVQVNVTTFVPKPFTPFQWADMASEEEIENKLDYLKDNLTGKGIYFDWNDPGLSRLEGVLARGDRRLGEIIFEVWRQGGRLEGWSEKIDIDFWEKAFEQSELSPEEFLNGYDIEDNLPWNHLNPGVENSFLIRELRESENENLTPDCRWSYCVSCGICKTPRDSLRLCQKKDEKACDSS